MISIFWTLGTFFFGVTVGIVIGDTLRGRYQSSEQMQKTNGSETDV